MDTYNRPKIADTFNDFLTNIGQKLSTQKPKSYKTFKIYQQSERHNGL